MTSSSSATDPVAGDPLTRPPLAALPEGTRSRLAELRTALERALGDDLVAIVVHGSAARGEHRADSDVDLLIVLREATAEKLAAIANPLALARNGARVDSMILVERELAPASDVFPLLYDDVREHHVSLAGGDPFAALTVSNRHRRLRIEQELREAQIRLRRLQIDHAGRLPSLAGELARKVKQLRSPLRALLALRGAPCPSDLGAVLAATAKAYAVDNGPLSRPSEAPAEAARALARLLDAAIADVDARGEAA